MNSLVAFTLATLMSFLALPGIVSARTPEAQSVDTVASFPGSTQNLGANTSPSPTHTVLVSSGSPSFVGTNVTFTATVTSVAGPIPDGETIKFYDGTTILLGSSVTKGGVASFSVSSFPAASHTIKVSYPGDANFGRSSATITQVVKRYLSTLTFAATPNPSLYGAKVSLQAKLTSASPTPPAGSITFLAGTTILGTVVLSTGSAILPLPPTPTGNLAMTATYGGDGFSSPASTKMVLTINPAPTSTSLQSSANPSSGGQLVAFTATVSSAAGGPTGSVTFFNGSVVLGTVPLAGGTAVLDSSVLVVGARTITATYNSALNFAGSSTSLTQQIDDPKRGLAPEFFGMGVATAGDMPKLSYGILSHPPGGWTASERSRGVYNFTTIDLFVLNAPKDGNGVALVDLSLGWTPAWAVADQSNCIPEKTFTACTVPPDNMQDWTDFVTALINHYNGVTAPHIKYYEIWTEANSHSFWTAGVPALITMAETAYPILKTDPNSFVLTPSVVWRNQWTTGIDFMGAFLKGGGYRYADGVTFHGYTSATGKGVSIPVPLPEAPSSTNASIETMLTAFRQVADTNGMKGKPLMTTEGGWGIFGVVDPDQQAAWVAHYIIVQAGLASTVNLKFEDWWAWGDATTGIVETPQGTPTLAGQSYQQVYNWLVNTQPTPCTTTGNIWSCPVSANLIVWDDSQTCGSGTCSSGNFTPPSGYTKYTDLTGEVTPITGPIPLGLKPILLEP
jgi:Bacterial Ig-like domain (group 3)